MRCELKLVEMSKRAAGEKVDLARCDAAGPAAGEEVDLKDTKKKCAAAGPADASVAAIALVTICTCIVWLLKSLGFRVVAKISERSYG